MTAVKVQVEIGGFPRLDIDAAAVNPTGGNLDSGLHLTAQIQHLRGLTSGNHTVPPRRAAIVRNGGRCAIVQKIQTDLLVLTGGEAVGGTKSLAEHALAGA